MAINLRVRHSTNSSFSSGQTTPTVTTKDCNIEYRPHLLYFLIPIPICGPYKIFLLKFSVEWSRLYKHSGRSQLIVGNERSGFTKLSHDPLSDQCSYKAIII